MPIIKKICKNCNKEFSRYEDFSRIKKGFGVYCSRKCAYNSIEFSKKISKKLTGRKLSDKHIENLRISHLGKHLSKKTKIKLSIFNKDKKISDIIRKKISNGHKGDKNYNWQGGISPENKRIRLGIEFRLWREAVFARDNWTCQKTGIKGGKLHPHHIQNFSQFPELRFAIDNGITLSSKVHKEFHKKYGFRNNTKEQIVEFLGDRVCGGCGSIIPFGKVCGVC